MNPAPIRVPRPVRLTDAELHASIDQALAGWDRRQDFWVFAYGSLMWNPSFDFTARKAARIFGYHRSFCLWSRINRGTPDNPGLVLALERGGSCLGCAYRIPRRKVAEVMWPLWEREMLYNSYLPRWLNCRFDTGQAQALAFVINPQATGYCGELHDAIRVRCIAGASGRYGTAADYLFNTVAALEEHGVRDRKLHQLAVSVREFCRCATATPPGRKSS